MNSPVAGGSNSDYTIAEVLPTWAGCGEQARAALAWLPGGYRDYNEGTA